MMNLELSEPVFGIQWLGVLLEFLYSIPDRVARDAKKPSRSA